MPILFRDLLEELKRFNSLSGRGKGKGGDGADRILPPILRTLQLLLASPTAAAGSARAGKLRLWDGGGDGLLEECVALEEEVRVAPVHLCPRRPLQRHVVDQLGVVDRTLQLAAEHDLLRSENR